VLCALVTLVAACTSEPTSPAPSRDPRPPDVRLSFIQQRLDEGTSRGNLRVISHDARALTVSRVGIDWPGYGDRVVQPMDGTIEPRQTLDLRVVLPPPVCEAPAASAYGIVVLAGVTVRARIDGSGRGYLTRMWQRACDERAFGDAVSVTYEGPWRTVRAFGYDALQGRVVMRRLSGDPMVKLTELTGSVLFELHLAHPLVLPPGQRATSAPVVFVPGRCDSHGLSQSQQTFVFRATVHLDNGRRMRVYVEPGRRARAEANAMLRRACG
jgi:hypothetical protein